MKSKIAIASLARSWASPSYIMLVGVPGCGKSTFIKQLTAEIKEQIFIASTDDLIELEAAKHGWTYSEAFHKVNQKFVKRQMEAGIVAAIEIKRSIIHDQTNMSKKSRAGKLKVVPDYYNKICLNFSVDDKVLLERLAAREKATGKAIPPFVLKSMFNSYEAPSKDEGFNSIIEINTT